jgi:hypothetical protein
LYGPDFNSLGANISRAAIVGGTVAALTGDKFANGAILGAFSYGFNDWSHRLAVVGGVTGAVATAGASLVGDVVTGGANIAATPEEVGAGFALGAAGGYAVGNWIDSWNGNVFSEGAPQTPDLIIVDPRGNAIPLYEGESVTSSPDSRWIQVRDKNGDETGRRLDAGHPSHSDPRAQGPHAHIPGVTNPDGTPWLPAK